MVIATGMAGAAYAQLYTAGVDTGETDRLSDEIERSMEFAQLLKDFDASQETEQERNARESREARALQDKRDREKRIAELRSRIAHLRSKIMSRIGGDERALNAELSMLQTELFWLMSMG